MQMIRALGSWLPVSLKVNCKKVCGKRKIHMFNEPIICHKATMKQILFKPREVNNPILDYCQTLRDMI